ncbi:MAG: hypothetical protein KAH57_11830 [Thermoplasmata archaeon]|nr:hypothetical protein [Thermoplasmata archaeon]
MDHFIERFIECSEKSRISTFLILPTSRAVKYVQKELHKRGIPYIKANITTLSGLSEALFNLDNNDRILLDNDQRAVIIDHLIEDARNEIPLIGRMSASSGVSHNLATFFSLLGSYGENYPDCLKKPSEKSIELGLLRERYEGYLRSHSLLDEEMMMGEVIGQDRAIETILIYDLFEPTPLEKEFIISLNNRSENMECYVPYIDNKKIFKDDWTWLGITEVEQISSNGLKDIFNGVPDKKATVKLFIGSMRDRVCEIRNVASMVRSILEDNDKEKIAVVLPEPDGGQRLVSEIFDDYGIPFHVSRGSSLSESPLIQDLVNILRVVSHNFMRKDVVNLLRSPYIKFRFQGKDISGNEVENISIGANVISGKSGWSNSLQNRMKVLGDEIVNPDISEGLKKRHEIELRKLEFTQDAIADLFSTIDRFSRMDPVLDHVKKFRTVIGKLEFYFDASSSSKPEASALK